MSYVYVCMYIVSVYIVCMLSIAICVFFILLVNLYYVQMFCMPRSHENYGQSR